MIFLKIYIQSPVLFQGSQVMLETISGWGQQNKLICIKQVSNLCVKEYEARSC